jgi:hypothetical protein
MSNEEQYSNENIDEIQPTESVDKVQSNEIIDEIQPTESVDKVQSNEIIDEIQSTDVPSSTSSIITTTVDDGLTTIVNDYSDEEIPDFIVKLFVDTVPDQLPSTTDLIDAAIVDSDGNLLSTSTSLIDSVDSYTQMIVDQLATTQAIDSAGKTQWAWLGTLKIR